jgi:hypothetical protein
VSWLANLFGGGARRRDEAAGGLCPPEAHPIQVRSTEVMAHVVRIRKAHTALHRALAESSASVRRLLEDSYGRLCGFVKSAYDLALRADKLRAHLDAEAAAAQASAELAATRRRLEAELGQITARLVEVASSLEAWHGKVLRMALDAPDAAERGARSVADELERMTHLIHALEEATKT